jgi:hypothetical protein
VVLEATGYDFFRCDVGNKPFGWGPIITRKTMRRFLMKRVVDRAAMVVVTITMLMCSGCAVVAVADVVVTVAAVVVKTGVKATGAVIDAVIPDSKVAKN